MNPEIAYVRLKPYDPSRGHIKKVFRMGAACGWQDLVFKAGQLMEIDFAAAMWLKENIHQREGRKSTPKAFDVWLSKAECAAALRAEEMDRLGRARTVPQSLKPIQPPTLQVAEISRIDEPVVTSALEVEMLAPELQPPTESKPNVVVSETRAPVSAFDAVAPSDEALIAAALDLPDEVDPPPRPVMKQPPKPQTGRKVRRAPTKRK